MVVEAMAEDMGLTEEQLDRFVILCGPRCVSARVFRGVRDQGSGRRTELLWV